MAKLTKTSKPGIFRRHVRDCSGKGRCDCPYVIVWRSLGRQYTETHRTMALAQEAKRRREAEVAEGAFAAVGRETLHDYARDWIERYQGTGRRGFREETRDDYRWNLERYALRYFPPDLKLAELSPRMVADFIGWLTRQKTRRDQPFSDSGVRNAFKPVSVCLGTARREGLIRHNPAADAVLPHRAQSMEDEEKARPFPRVEIEGELVESMERVVQSVESAYRLMFELLAVTGLRRSELLALEGRHLAISANRPHIKIRQRIRRRKGEGLIIGPLKSRYARRDLPLPEEMAEQLASLGVNLDELVFQTGAGTPHDADNLLTRVLRPACKQVGVDWAGFHTFRHTVASRLFAEGRNAVQVQRWLGHHSPSFTLDTYVHLLDPDLGEPLGGSDQLAA